MFQDQLSHEHILPHFPEFNSHSKDLLDQIASVMGAIRYVARKGATLRGPPRRITFEGFALAKQYIPGFFVCSA